MDAEQTGPEQQAGENAGEQIGKGATTGNEATGNETSGGEGLPIPVSDANSLGWDKPVSSDGIVIGGRLYTGSELNTVLLDAASLVDEMGGVEAFQKSVQMIDDVSLCMSSLLSKFDEQARKLEDLLAGDVSRSKLRATVEGQVAELRSYHRRLHPVSACIAAFRDTTVSRWLLAESRLHFVKASISTLTNDWRRLDLLIHCVNKANEFCLDVSERLKVNLHWKAIKPEAASKASSDGAK